MSAMPLEVEPAAAAAADGAAADDEGALAALLAKIAAGSEAALARLYRALAAPVFALALWRTGSRDDAAEVVQETFLRIARERDRLVRVRRPRVWVLTIAHRLAVDALRRRRRHAADPDAELALLAAPADDPGRDVDAARASALLATLPARQREVVCLHLFEGLTFAEVGRVAGVPTFTAASRYRLAIARLRRALEAKR
jgi:RNA polymerase sigma-70 factor (ECF subfamily)